MTKDNLVVVPGHDRKKGTVRERAEKIKKTADTPMEEKYAGDIHDKRYKEWKTTFKKDRVSKKGHSKGTRAYNIAEKEKMEELKGSLSRAQKDLSLLEDYKSEAPQARSFMTKQKKAGGGYVKKYAKGSGVRKPRMGVN